ncbi:MAG TPA: rRNA adenine N-6-methyltransferase family protein [Chthoniobacteraceae bacterium]|jgi:phosphatidylethanolamine/phosphatidyl-N-methylethanolamine N-methyltransferase|nr:rRNA adenine N-6-methyltransferase family protein [Chthoniobacteraceae bacterium]
MSVIFLKRFLQRPFQVASIVPSSKTLIRKVASQMDLSGPRVVAEFGPGEGCHTREILSRMHPESRLLLFELDPELSEHLATQFRDDARVAVLNTDACELPAELAARGIPHCDYVVSGIPFSILDPDKKRQLLRHTFDSLAPHPRSAFIIYQVTNELVNHCRHFPRVESQYCLQNLPPMFVTKFYRMANGHTNGHAHPAVAHAVNGNGRH